MVNMKRFLVAGMLLFFLAACVRPPGAVTRPEDALAHASTLRLAMLRDDLEFRDMESSVRNSLDYYKKLAPETAFLVGPDRVSAFDMTVTLQSFLQIIENSSLTMDQKIDRIKRDFRFYRAVGSDGKGKVLFTGYYEPLLSCRVTADKIFRYPLYRKPDDIVEIDLSQFGEGFPRSKLFGRLDGKKVIPYFSRQEIDQKKILAGRNLEILWCSDIFDIYVLQVQGSGKADLGDGNILSVLYDGSNGRPYTSIGKYLIEAGVMTRESMSMQAIREYLHTHPDKLLPVLNLNASYVFFRLDTGPSLGNIGVPLTPDRSIATDSRLFPKGALGFIVTRKPVIENGAIKSWMPFGRFVVNQDTGGAIKGPGRADLFCGQGPDAELTAGNLQQEGELYFLLKKK